MAQSIFTKYYGPRNKRGSRIIASASNPENKLTLEYDDELSANENPTVAAAKLASKMKWTGQWTCGAGQKGEGCVFIQVSIPEGFIIYG